MPGLVNKYVLLRSRLNGLPRDISWGLGLNRSYIKNSKTARILIYHGICHNDPLRFNMLFLKQRTFESQLRFYKKYFNIVSLDDFYNRRWDNKKSTVCITFDDGFANNYKYVLPLLQEYKIPATFFITGIRDAGYDILWNDLLCLAYKYGPSKFNFRGEEFIKGGDSKYVSVSTNKRLVDTLRLNGFEGKAEMMRLLVSLKHRANEDYWLQMTVEQIITLSASKWVTIGSHGYYHNDLAKIPSSSTKEELLRSKQFLENSTGKEIKALAFPYGSYSKEVVQAAKNTGFSQLLATEFLFPEDPADTTMRERLTINPFISNINQMHANIAGNYK